MGNAHEGYLDLTVFHHRIMIYCGIYFILGMEGCLVVVVVVVVVEVEVEVEIIVVGHGALFCRGLFPIF